MALIIVFIFGLVIGSFLNVVIWRLHTGESALKGRSYCPKCKHRLDFFDLFPVMSFVIQGGKCRYCRESISWQYPFVELATAALFVMAYVISDFSAEGGLVLGRQLLILLKYWFVVSAMIIVFVYDAKHYLILDKVIYPAAAVAFFASPLLSGDVWWRGIPDGLLAAAIGGGFFLFQYAVSKGKWIGGGDVKLGFLMGLFLGVKGLLVAFFFSYCLGAVVGLGLVAAGRKNMKGQLPFGTFLAAGTLIALFWAEPILKWYLN